MALFVSEMDRGIVMPDHILNSYAVGGNGREREPIATATAVTIIMKRPEGEG